MNRPAGRKPASRKQAARPDAEQHRGGGGWTKSGKPRPGTGGKGRRALEGKGPTPPAEMRPGHPAQRRAARTTAGTRGAGGERPGGERSGGRARNELARGAGEAAEYVAGRNPVVESLRAGVPASTLYLGPRGPRDDRVEEATALAAAAGVAVLRSSPGELDRLTGGAVHQGIALQVRPYRYAHPDDLPDRAEAAGQLPLIVALDGVTDPRNLGAVVRSAGAFGGHGVLVPARRSAGVTAGAWKASAGALARVPVAKAPNLARALQAYRDAGIFVAGLDGAGDTEVADLPVADAPLVLVAGSEGRGLSRIAAQACDVLVRIPIAADTESLNAGVAASIALYQVSLLRATA